MKKKIIRFLLWFTGIIVLIIALFSLVLYLNQDRIKAAVITEVNHILEEPVDVKAVEVSLRKFPYASLAFQEVFSAGLNGQEGDTLLYAERVYFEFHLWNVFSSNLSIHRISLENGTAKIIRPELGLPNYTIWKQDSSSSSSLFTLEEVSFQNFKLYQFEGAANQMSYGRVKDLLFSGSFDADNYSIQNSSSLYLDSLKVNDFVYLQSVNATTSFTLTGGPNTTKIFDGLLEIEDTEVEFAVDIEPNGVKVLAQNEDLELRDFQQLAATQNWGVPQDIEVEGKANLTFLGVFNHDQEPDIELQFITTDAILSGNDGTKLKDFTCNGSYHLRDNRDHIRLDHFVGKGRSGSFEGALDINDLSNPGIVLDLKSDLELSEWLSFIPADTITKPEGRAIVDVHFENKFKSLRNIAPEELKQAKANGSLVLKDVAFSFKNTNRRIEDLNAELRFLGNDLKIANLIFRTGESDIYLEGVFENVLNYAYFKDQQLKVDAKLKAQKVVMEDFISDATSSSNNDGDYSLEFIKDLDLELELTMDQFYFDQFYASDILGQLRVKNGVIQAKSISLNSDEGVFNGNMTIDTRKENYLLRAELKAESVNIHDLFNSFRNFGQDAITADNLYGKANLDMNLICTMNSGLDIDLSSISMNSHLAIENGNLKEYEPMMALSRFADIKELRDVRFSHLENDISIQNSKVIIPLMNIESNVLDMGLQGEHGFDNIIDYSIRLKLSDVIFTNRKKQRKTSEFDDHLIEVEKDDDPNIYVGMKGPIENPKIELDRKNISKSINRDLKEQRKSLKKIFNKKEKDEKKDDSGIQFDLFDDEK